MTRCPTNSQDRTLKCIAFRAGNRLRHTGFNALKPIDLRDTDWDGTGDACNDADDIDGDEWADALDNCPAIANVDQTDSDSDGMGDVCDDDDDNDGLSDIDEANEGTDPLDPYTDGDGFLDGDEVVVGTDPLDPLDNFQNLLPSEIPAFEPWGTAVLASLFLLASFLVLRLGPKRTR